MPDKKSFNSNPNVVFKEDKVKANSDSVTVLDSDWLKNSFFISDKNFMGTSSDPYKEAMLKQRYHTSADYKFTSTSLGMNMAMNPKPQYTPYADIRSKGRLKHRESVRPSNMLGDYGMGAYYSEAIDDTAERIYLRFGVPQFNSLFNYLSSSYSPWMATAMSKGRYPGEIEQALVAAFSAVITVVSAVFILNRVPLMLVAGLGAAGALNYLIGGSRFYNFKPTMHSYWLFVDAIVNSLVNYRGLAPFVKVAKERDQMNSFLDRRPSSTDTITEEALKKLHEAMPDFVGEEGRINIFSVVLRAQRIFNRIQELEEENENLYQSSGQNSVSYSIDKESEMFREAYFSATQAGNELTNEKFINKYLTKNPLTSARKTEETSQAGASVSEPSFQVQDHKDPESYISYEATQDTQSTSEKAKPKTNYNDDGTPKKEFESTFDAVKQYFKAELKDGLGFICLNVESTGSISESFSSQTKPIPLQTTLLQTASGARDIIYNFAGGTTGIAGVDTAISMVAGAVKEGISNISLGLLDPVLAALSGINVEMPKMWDSSDARLPPTTYRMRLMSPYGNAFSQIQNIYIPLAMLLAGTLPRAAGHQTHTAPFICQVFNRGRMQSSLGIITSLSISRGVSNLPFNRFGQAMAIDVDFTIEDLSSTMFMNVMQGSLLDLLKDVFVPAKSASLEDNAFSDYLKILAGVDVYNQIYFVPRARLKLGEFMMRLNRIKDPAYLSSMMFNLPIVNFVTSVGQIFNQEDYKSKELR